MQVSQPTGSTSVSRGRVCGKCGGKVFADAPQGFCSVCLLETGLGSLLDDSEDSKQTPILMEFGDYDLIEEIGRGGQGVVYRARQKSLNRTVALKVIGLGHWASTPHLKRFRQEAEAAARLEHPQIVPIYEIAERDGSCYFSMKFVEGGQLDHVIKREPMSIRRAAELLVKIARTVQFAHKHGILHRDIKPGNILLDKNGEPHLTDFGLARLIEDQSTITNSFDVLGTPSYMAPEQAAGRTKELTAAADVYALGAVFYQMLTGQPPFAGGTTYETIRLLMETEPRHPRLWNPKVDVDLATICLKCLEKDPAKRYGTAENLAEDVERWLRHEPIRARPANVFTRTRKWIRRNPAKAVLIPSLAAVAILAFNTVWNREPAAPPSGIAVLPFENLSADKENTFLADGVQDDILTKLAKIADLKVISRTSVMQYRGERNMRKIGDALRVSHLLEGSLRREGERLHINAQLIEARSDRHVWAEQYDVDPVNLFSVQSEIAQNIAKQLKSKVSSTERAAINTQPTRDLEAYKFYQQAKQLSGYSSPTNPATFENYEHAIDLLEKAVARDPNFVLAHCLLVHTGLKIYWSNGRANLAARDRAETALREAQRLAPDAGETHLAAAAFYHYAIRDFDRALEQLDMAARLLPNSADVFFSSALIERRLGRWGDALRHFSKSNDLNPRDPSAVMTLIVTHNFLRHFAEADKLTDRAIAAFPEKADEFWNNRGIAALDQGDVERARTATDKISSGFPALRFFVLYYGRKFADAETMSLPVWQGKQPELRRYFTFYSALAARAVGATDRMRSYLLAAREAYEPPLSAEPDPETLTYLGMIDVALGRTEQGIAECRRAVELEPIERNAMEGPWYVKDLAIAYVWVGDRERALEQLSTIAKLPNASIGFGELKLDPIWDPLRDDPRFAQILAEMSKPIALKETHTPNPTLKSEKGVAVLPFENLSKDEADTFLTDGVQDEILRDLMAVEDLKVINRTSVIKYKPGEKRDLRAIAKALGVTHVVEGSVQRMGERIRVSAQLVDARNAAPVWADRYDREITEIFTIQNTIPRKIVETLRARVTGAEAQAMASLPTQNVAAHQLYLRGRYFYDKRAPGLPTSRSDIEKAIDYFNQAIGKDPNFALAHAGLADCYLSLQFYPGTISSEYRDRAVVAAGKALELDDSLGEVHAALAVLLLGENFPEARRELLRAIELSPNYSTAHQWLSGYIFTASGEFDQGLREANRAVELDPFSRTVNNNLAFDYVMARRYPEAIAQYRKAIELDPSVAGLHWNMAKPLELSGQYEEAIAEYEKGSAAGKQFSLSYLTHVYAANGEREKASKTLKQLEELEKSGVVWPFGLAIAHTGLGNKDRAVDWLERSCREKDPNAFFIKVDPFFDPLRGNPRFEKLVNQVIPPDGAN